jgi:hypothetical protein
MASLKPPERLEVCIPAMCPDHQSCYRRRRLPEPCTGHRRCGLPDRDEMNVTIGDRASEPRISKCADNQAVWRHSTDCSAQDGANLVAVTVRRACQ